VGAGRARRLAALLTVAFFVLTGCAGVAGPDAPDVFADGLDPGVGARPDLWMAWSLVDRADGRRAGSANAAMERTNAESSIKAWITTAYLRDAEEDGRAASAEDLALIDRAIRASDDAAAEKLYRKLGADRVLAELEPACGVRVRTSERHYWSYAQISAEDATRILGCVLEQAPRYPHGDRLVDALHHVDPDGAFGIPEALGPDVDVAVKNGWTRHEGAGTWNVNCVAAWDHYTLAVLTRFPADRDRDYGAGSCRDVTAAVLKALP
jgi:hypothetical protein